VSAKRDLTNPLQGVLRAAARTLPATTGRVAAQQQRIDRRRGAAVILADISASMAGAAWGGQRKIDVLREAVSGAQQQRTARLVVFSSAPRDASAVPEPESNTDLAAALTFASAADPGVTLVISDGHPDNPAAALAVAQTFRGAIDVLYVGPESDHAAIDFMRKLAAAAGGDTLRHDIGALGNARLLQTKIAGLLT